MERVGIPNGTERFEQALYQRTGLHLKELWPTEFAKSVTVPTMVAQVRRDFTIRPSLIEEIYGYISATDKKLYWIEGTDQRFQGYNHFGREPQAMLDWFDGHMS